MRSPRMLVGVTDAVSDGLTRAAGSIALKDELVAGGTLVHRPVLASSYSLSALFNGGYSSRKSVSQVMAGRICPSLVIRPEFDTQVWPTM
jgi:hypothetical protein